MHLSDLRMVEIARVQAPIHSAEQKNQFHVSAIVAHTVVSGWSGTMVNKQLFVLCRLVLEEGFMEKR